MRSNTLAILGKKCGAASHSPHTSHMKQLSVTFFIACSLFVQAQTGWQFNNRMTNYYQSRQYDDAIRYLDSVISVNATCAWCYVNKARIYAILDKPTEVVDAIEEGLSINDSTVLEHLLLVRANHFYDQREYDKAYSEYDMIYTKLNPENYLALSAMGSIEIFQYKNVKSGREKIVKAYKSGYPNPMVELIYARLMVEERNFEVGKRIYFQHLASADEMPGIYFHLAECLMQLKSYDSALFYYERALPLAESEMKKEIQYLIDGIKSLPGMNKNRSN